MSSQEIRPLVVVDFARLVRDILARGEFTRGALAMHANIPRTSLFNYENGVMPLHPIGERLIEIWCKAFDMSRDKVPRRAASLTPTPSHPRFPSLEKISTTR
jgi:hypothetical protein